MEPLYRQVKKKITESLVKGDWNPGQSIPSEIELAQVYAVSQGTVRKAIDELTDERILIRRQGKGTFVASHNEENIQLRFLRLTSNSGAKEKLDNELISFTKEKANNHLAKSLQINANSTVISIKRILTFNKTPLIFDHIKIPASYFRGLNEDKVLERNGSMYRMYEMDYGIRMISAEEKIKAVSADRESASLLKVDQKTPLLSVERLAFTYDQKPIEWRYGLCLTQDHYYWAELD